MRFPGDVLRKINTKQLIVLLSAVLLLFLSEMFPPWLYEDGMTSAQRSAGFHYSQPELKSLDEMNRIFSNTGQRRSESFKVHQDLGRLYCQRMILTFLPLGLLFALASRRSSLKIFLSVTCFCIGLAFLALYVLLVT